MSSHSSDGKSSVSRRHGVKRVSIPHVGEWKKIIVKHPDVSSDKDQASKEKENRP